MSGCTKQHFSYICRRASLLYKPQRMQCLPGGKRIFRREASVCQNIVLKGSPCTFHHNEKWITATELSKTAQHFQKCQIMTLTYRQVDPRIAVQQRLLKMCRAFYPMIFPLVERGKTPKDVIGRTAISRQMGKERGGGRLGQQQLGRVKICFTHYMPGVAISCSSCRGTIAA